MLLVNNHLLLFRHVGASEIATAESLQYHLAIIQAATNDFCHRNKLGEGGFGAVFQVLSVKFIIFCKISQYL